MERDGRTEPEAADLLADTSVMAAAFGGQSGRNRARDFSHGKPVHFIGVGLTLVFVLLLAGIVNWCWSLQRLRLLRRRGGPLVADPEHRGRHHQQDQDEGRAGVDHAVAALDICSARS